MEFENKVAVVTGGAMGIGRASALAFAREGAAVTVADVNAQKGRETVEAIQRQKGKALLVAGDVSKAADARRTAEETVRAFGRLDILHNNAPIQTYGTASSTPEEEGDRPLSINLKSVYLCSKYCMRALLGQAARVVHYRRDLPGRWGLAGHFWVLSRDSPGPRLLRPKQGCRDSRIF